MEFDSTDSGGAQGSSGEEEDEYFYRDSKSQRAERRRRRREDATFGVFGDEEVEVEGGMKRGGLGFVSFVQEEKLGTTDLHAPVMEMTRNEAGGRDSLEHVDMDQKDEEEEVVTGAFGRRVRKAAAERRQREWGTQGKGIEKSRKTVTAPGKSVVGTFEAHTKGIGAKLLSKMGWKQGQGLGKDGKGLSQPLEATLRPKRQGMGFGNRREPSLAPKEDTEEKKTREEKTLDVQQEAKAWRKKRADSKLQEKKQIFKTVDDVLASSDGTAKSSIQTIIDMRGPQKRVIHDVGVEGALLEKQCHAYDDGPLPELQHNMRLLVDLNEAEIKKVHARITHSKNTKILLEKERLRLLQQKSSADTIRKNLARAVSHASKIRDAINRGMNSLSAESRSIFSETRAILGNEYYAYKFHLLAAAVIQRQLVQQAQTWSPLADPTMLLPQISEWKALLTTENHSNTFYSDEDVNIDRLFASSDPFVMLIVDVVLPRLRSDIQSSWDPKDSDSLEVFLDSWRTVLPSDVILYVMQHAVLPKLRVAVETWDPLVDEIAPHTWLLPPLPYLGNHAKDLWPIVRMKFVAALAQWHPSDPTALEMLTPWRRVFSSHDWDHLCSRAIEPKLSHVLENEFVIHVSRQDLEPFSWVMAWETEIRPERFAKILDRHFFPKWRAALRHMLMHEPNYDEIARWYISWKSYISDEVLETPQVAKNIEAALRDMSRVVAGEPLEPTWTTAPSPEEDHAEPLIKLKASQRAQLTMKELITQFAEDAGVDFIPKLGRMHEGLQVYHFGLVLCAVNTAQETIVAQIDPKSHTWKNVSLDELLDENDRRLRGGTRN